MEFSGQSPVKLVDTSTVYGDQIGSQLIIKQPTSGLSMDAGNEDASDASLVAAGNMYESSGNPRPSRRVIPADEPGTHQVTFTVTISVALPPSESFDF